jgi:hypothetical protein
MTAEQEIGRVLCDFLELDGLSDDEGRDLSQINYNISLEKSAEYLALSQFAVMLKEGAIRFNKPHDNCDCALCQYVGKIIDKF